VSPQEALGAFQGFREHHKVLQIARDARAEPLLPTSMLKGLRLMILGVVAGAAPGVSGAAAISCTTSSTNLRSTLHTLHNDCVTITSGRSCLRTSWLMKYKPSPVDSVAVTASFICSQLTKGFLAPVRMGRSLIAAG